MKTLLRYLELAFWIISGLLTLIGAFGMLIKGAWAVYQEFAALKHVMTHELFYAIIAFELFQMARVRVEGKSHKIVLYHFIFMATLTLGREIFLIHNLDIWIIVGFSIMVGVYVFYWMWKEDKPDMDSELRAEERERVRLEGRVD